MTAPRGSRGPEDHLASHSLLFALSFAGGGEVLVELLADRPLVGDDRDFAGQFGLAIDELVQGSNPFFDRFSQFAGLLQFRVIELEVAIRLRKLEQFQFGLQGLGLFDQQVVMLLAGADFVGGGRQRLPSGLEYPLFGFQADSGVVVAGESAGEVVLDLPTAEVAASEFELGFLGFKRRPQLAHFRLRRLLGLAERLDFPFQIFDLGIQLGGHLPVRVDLRNQLGGHLYEPLAFESARDGIPHLFADLGLRGREVAPHCPEPDHRDQNPGPDDRHPHSLHWKHHGTVPFALGKT